LYIILIYYCIVYYIILIYYYIVYYIILIYYCIVVQESHAEKSLHS